MTQGAHLTDRELMLLAHGEWSGPSADLALEHTTQCEECRERLVSFSRVDIGIEESSLSAARDRLTQNLAAAHVRPGSSVFPGRIAAAALASAAAIAIFAVRLGAEGPRPRPALTPGDVRPITTAEVCRAADAQVIVSDIPVETRRRVLEAYGIRSSRAEDFEVDYLITPDLGGTGSVRNLWPQPYSARWNARQKDRLEQRLHQMVCGGRLDLATAQREIAADWIAAYKKYLGEQ